MTRSKAPAVLLLSLALSFPALAARAQSGDARAGEELAARLCGICHLLDEAGSRAHPSAPPMRAAVRGRSPEWLGHFLFRPHGDMPELDLTTREIDDLVAYLTTLPQ